MKKIYFCTELPIHPRRERRGFPADLVNDLPQWMIEKDFLHVDIEAKAKEVAIKQLRESIGK